MDEGDKVREMLGRMSRNFSGLSDQFKIVGREAGRAMRSIGALKLHGRAAGAMAAAQDWGDKLWPAGDEERDEDV